MGGVRDGRGRLMGQMKRLGSLNGRAEKGGPGDRPPPHLSILANYRAKSRSPASAAPASFHLAA